MIFFLDLDRTMLKTDDLTIGLVRAAGRNEKFNLSTLSEYVYPDVIPFLKKARTSGHTLVLITRGDPELQKAKAAHSGITEFFDDALYVESGSKSSAIQEYLSANRHSPENAVFIDDTVFELEDAQNAHPSIRVIRMKRPDAKSLHIAAPHLQEISSFDEFQELIYGIS